MSACTDSSNTDLIIYVACFDFQAAQKALIAVLYSIDARRVLKDKSEMTLYKLSDDLSGVLPEDVRVHVEALSQLLSSDGSRMLYPNTYSVPMREYCETIAKKAIDLASQIVEWASTKFD